MYDLLTSNCCRVTKPRAKLCLWFSPKRSPWRSQNCLAQQSSSNRSMWERFFIWLSSIVHNFPTSFFDSWFLVLITILNLFTLTSLSFPLPHININIFLFFFHGYVSCNWFNFSVIFFFFVNDIIGYFVDNVIPWLDTF